MSSVRASPSTLPAAARSPADTQDPRQRPTARRHRFSRVRWHARRDGWRRLLNVSVAASALLLCAPLLLLIASALKCNSSGKVFYTQPRVGLDRRRLTKPGERECRRKQNRGGQVFTIIKFRTMHSGNDPLERWSDEHYSRITPVGAVLRKQRLDELPQFLNVIRGEMNIVGPRPEQPAIFQDLAGTITQYKQRQRVLPGITGWAQINHRADQCIEDVQRKVTLDLEYMRQNPTFQIGVDGSNQSRVSSVLDALTGAGIPANRIQVGAFGDPQLRRDNRVAVLLIN